MPPTRPADRDMWRIIAVPLIIWGRSLRHLCLLTAGIPKAVSTGSHIQCLTGIMYIGSNFTHPADEKKACVIK